MKQKTLSLPARMNSFGFAIRGISKFFQQEPNAWIHLVATVFVFLAAIYYHVSNSEKVALIIVTGFVWVSEIFNTVIERMMDFISEKRDPKIEYIKDLSAGGVLLSAISAIVTGAIIFIPKLF